MREYVGFFSSLLIGIAGFFVVSSGFADYHDISTK